MRSVWPWATKSLPPARIPSTRTICSQWVGALDADTCSAHRNSTEVYGLPGHSLRLLLEPALRPMPLAQVRRCHAHSLPALLPDTAPLGSGWGQASSIRIGASVQLTPHHQALPRAEPSSIPLLRRRPFTSRLRMTSSVVCHAPYDADFPPLNTSRSPAPLRVREPLAHHCQFPSGRVPHEASFVGTSCGGPAPPRLRREPHGISPHKDPGRCRIPASSPCAQQRWDLPRLHRRLPPLRPTDGEHEQVVAAFTFRSMIRPIPRTRRPGKDSLALTVPHVEQVFELVLLP
jgi:hypothetical protein